jgi:hypothetical protein
MSDTAVGNIPCQQPGNLRDSCDMAGDMLGDMLAP